jgi:hypothetical protein
MNTHSQDIKLFRLHLDVLKDRPLSLPQEGALQRIEADLANDDLFVENIAKARVHLGIIGKYSLTDSQRQALDLAGEVVEKISLSENRGNRSSCDI